jgi:hypothetical protein
LYSYIQMKYLVIKGWLGFGDRLESLKMGIQYALKHNLKVYVDWTDPIWSHGNESFYTYFKLVNIPQIASLDEIPADATVYPAFWKDNLKRPFDKELQEKGKELKLDVGQLVTPFDADVVVMSNCGMRTLFEDSSFFANVFRVVDPRVLSKIRQRKSQYNLSTTIGVHIRGTDKFTNADRRTKSTQYACLNAVLHGALNGKPMVVVSDDKESMTIWKNYFPQSVLLSEVSLQQSSIKGNHNLSKEELKVTKDELNVDLLVDFFTLALASRIIVTNKDSRFPQEARRLHPVVNTILGQ